jgi:hypothetical protein
MKKGRLAGWEWLAAMALLLAAAALRLARFEAAPPGVIHDEVLNWLNTRLVLSGDIRVLYPYGGGREGLYFLFQAAAFQLFGSNLIAARFPSLAFNLIGLCALYAFARRMMGRSGALVAMAGWAGAFWPLMFSRLGVRTGSMPAMALLAAYWLVRWVSKRTPTPTLPLTRGRESGAGGRERVRRFLGTRLPTTALPFGILLGLTLYTYPAALMLPAIFLTWALLHPRHLRGRWAGLALAFLVAGLMAIPLVLAWRDPSATARAAAIDAPLEALLAGDPGPVIDNILPIVGNFTFAGDHGLEFNLQDQPIFPQPLMAALFYAGLGIALWRAVRYRDHRYTLLLLWLVGMMIPTLVTYRPVNPSRTIGLMSVVYLFPAAVMAEARALSHNNQPMRKLNKPFITKNLQPPPQPSPFQGEGGRRLGGGRAFGVQMLSGPPIRWALAAVAAAALGWQAAATARGYFVDWATNPVVRFLYQEDDRLLAADWDAAPPELPTALGGLTPDQMDPVTMLLLLDDDALAGALGTFDPQTALLLPEGEECLVVIPRFVTLHPALAAWMAPYTVGVEEAEAYQIYQIHPPTLTEEALFVQPDGTEVAYLGSAVIAGGAQPGQTVTVATLWRAASASPFELRIFVHLTDAAGNILTQSDVLGVPATQWRAGDVIVQAHDLALPDDAPAGPYGLAIGIYEPVSGIRLRVGDGDFLYTPLIASQVDAGG